MTRTAKVRDRNGICVFFPLVIKHVNEQRALLFTYISYQGIASVFIENFRKRSD